MSHPPEARVQTTPRILVAEDDPDMLDLVTTTLQADGYQVITARSGDDAARALSQLSPRQRMGEAGGLDLLLTDVRMAEGDGLQLLDGLRAAGWPIPVIIMTGAPDQDVRTEAIRMHAQVLAKPFSLATLRREVLHALATAARSRSSFPPP